MNPYQAELLERSKFPQFRGELLDRNASSHQENLSCGDEVTVQAKIENNILKNASYKGEGCIISQAAADIIIETCLHKQVRDILSLGAADITGLIGIELSPSRVKCAIIGLVALQTAIKSYQRSDSPQQ